MPDPIALAPETKSFQGSYLLFRKKGHALVRGSGTTERTRPPRFRHTTFESAEKEARRLLGILPDSTFVIIREVGRVKLKPVDEGQRP